MTAMISLGANYRICLRTCVFVCVTELEEGNVCVAHPSVSVPTEVISWIIGVFSPKRVCDGSGRAEITQTHLQIHIKPPHRHSPLSSPSVCLVGWCPAASVLSCHLLREDDLTFWLNLWMRGERECSLTKSSGNLYWGNIVSKKPSRKT